MKHRRALGTLAGGAVLTVLLLLTLAAPAPLLPLHEAQPSMEVVPSTTSTREGPLASMASSTPNAKPATSPVTTEVGPRGPVDVVLSCFFKSEGFYKTRQQPPSKWIHAFLRSAHRHRRAPQRNARELRVVLFVDDGTGTAIQRLVAEDPWKTHLVEDTGFVWPPEASSAGGAAAPGGLAFLTLVRVNNRTHAALLQQPWASKIRNGANNFRFALFGDWLRRGLAGGIMVVDRVMMSDVTDVVFQANPFDACLPPPRDGGAAVAIMPRSLRGEAAAAAARELHPGLTSSSTAAAVCTGGEVVFTLEDSSKNFYNEQYNKRWMACLGDAAARNLSRHRAPISCAGVTFADRCGAVKYAAAQVALISQPDLVDCAINRVNAALDQATHNFILASAVGTVSLAARGLPPVDFTTRTTFTEGGAAVKSVAGRYDASCTFHGNFVQRPWLSGDGAVLGEGGKPFAVVHQYTSNRHPAVMKAVAATYQLDP